MYGLLVEGLFEAMKTRYEEDVINEIVSKAGLTFRSFSIHKTYSETMIPRLAKSISEVTKVPLPEVMDFIGTDFVTFVGQYGYDRILRVLGRNLRDFLNGLDNLHEYLRFSYPKMKPPSFFCENETRQGLILHYRSKRKGYLYYVMGQIRAVGVIFYRTPVEVELIKEEETLDMTHVTMKLHFDNSAFADQEQQVRSDLDQTPINSVVFFDSFPFHVVFSRLMMIRNIGAGLKAIMPNLIGQNVDEMFMLVRPLVEFSLDNVMMHTNNVFEIYSVDAVRRVAAREGEEDIDGIIDDDDPDDPAKKLRMKGQMLYMREWDSIIFLGTPIMDNLEKMFETGLYINDLSMHDSSRDLVLAGTQQSAELKLALDQEKNKSLKLEESMRKLDQEMKRTDSLLYQMIPKAVADRLRKGEASVDTCQTFDNVTILFTDVVGFTKICSQLTPMGVVAMLNMMYTKFDKLSEKHRVYKVETIGDAYMTVSGAPVKTKFHALYICDMAFDMLKALEDIADPSGDGHIRIRVGIHSGMVVAGVVGLKMPRYCLFGDTVNAANKMESSGQPMKIHITETTKRELDGFPYRVEERSTMQIREVTYRTFWLLEKTEEGAKSRVPYSSTLDDASELDGNTNVAVDADELPTAYAPVVPRDVR